jgi:hypothetical protein
MIVLQHNLPNSTKLSQSINIFLIDMGIKIIKLNPTISINIITTIYFNLYLYEIQVNNSMNIR